MKVNKPGGTINIPPIYRTGLLLLVEVKKASPACQMFEFLKVMEQTDQQARHAFAYYPRVSIFGMVIAIGDLWLYREYYREDLRPSPTLSEHLDSSFMDSDLDEQKTSRLCADVEKFFDARGFARLQEKTSNDALDALRKRLTALGSSMF